MTDADLMNLADAQGQRLVRCFVANGRWIVRLHFAQEAGDGAAEAFARRKLKRSRSGIDVSFALFKGTLHTLAARGLHGTALSLLSTWPERALRAEQVTGFRESTRLFNAIPRARLAVLRSETPGVAEAA